MTESRQDRVASGDPSDARMVEMLFGMARRYAEDLSIVSVEAPTGPETAPGAPERLAEAVHGVLRRSDQLVQLGEAAYRIYCPKTKAAGACLLAQRIHDEAAKRELRDVFTGVASFPEDALTLRDLEDAADQALYEAFDSVPTEATLAVAPRELNGPRPTRRKRLFDLAAVIGTAPLWGPLMAAVALGVYLSDPKAPVVFRQLRTGRGGRRFHMLKFRTMVANAEELKAELAHLNELQPPDFKITNDPRVTPIGKLLRKSSLDELPQLLNVLKGDMSLVGPRPTSFAPETYQPWHTERLDVTPGLTGLWQVEGRASTEFDERLRLDIKYIEGRGLRSDLALLIRTVWAILTARGAR